MPVAVIVGIDPHKRSATIEIVDECGQKMTTGRYCTDNAGYAEILQAGRRFPGVGVGGRGLQRHRQTPRPLAGPRRGGRRGCAGEAVRAGAGVRPRQHPARVTQSMRTRWPWPRCARRTWSGLRSMRTWSRVGMLADRRDELGRARTQTVNGSTGCCWNFLWWSEEVPLRYPGPRPGRDDHTPRPCRQDPPPARRRADQRTGVNRQEKQNRRRRARRCPRVHAQATCTASARPAQLAPWPTWAISTASATGTGSRPGTAPPRWMPPPAPSNATDSPEPETAA